MGNIAKLADDCKDYGIANAQAIFISTYSFQFIEIYICIHVHVGKLALTNK